MCPCLSCAEEPRTGFSMLSRGKGSPPSTCWEYFCLMHPGYHWSPLLQVCTVLAPARLGVHQDPQVLFFWAVFWLVTPRMFWCLGLFLPKSRTLHLSLLNSVRLLASHFSSLLTSLWMAAQPSWCINHSSQFSISFHEIFHTCFCVLVCAVEPWLSDILCSVSDSESLCSCVLLSLEAGSGNDLGWLRAFSLPQ